jgi:hypothetical protein
VSSAGGEAVTPERYQQINELLDLVLKLEPSQRPAYLDRVCAGDEALRREIESLLAVDAQASIGGEPLRSVWKMPAAQTRELMEDFYRRILVGQPRAGALREAQLEMKKYPDPFFWGVFICQDNPGPLPLHASV